MKLRDYLDMGLISIFGIAACFWIVHIIPDGVKCVDGKIYTWEGAYVYKPTDRPCITVK